MRRWLIVLLCLCLPLQAWARLPVAKSPCPMAAMAAAQQADEPSWGQAEHDSDADCCDDLAPCLQPGAGCQAGKGLGAAAWALPPADAGALVVACGLHPAGHAMPAQASTGPDRIWRPPAPR